MEFIVYGIVLLCLIAAFILEHKQKMETLEFEERLYKLKQKFLEDFDKEEKTNGSKKIE